MKKILCLALLFSLLCSTELFAYSYSAYAFSTGKNTLAINPFLYGFKVAGDWYGGGDICASYGITDKIDVFADFNYLYGAGAGTPGWYGMLRYDFGGTKIVAVKANDVYVSPQFHYLVENDRWGFQANAAVQITYDYADLPAAFAILCPLYKPLEWLDIFCDVNPSWTSADGDLVVGWVRPKGFGLDVVPGVGLKIGPVLLSVACPIFDVTGDPTPSFGAWGLYLVTFGKGK